jgi:hypothetical protein
MRQLPLLCALILSSSAALAQQSTLLYYVSGRPAEHGIWVSRETPDGKYTRGTKVLLDGVFDGNAVDPDLIMLPNGKIRMYYFKGYFVSQPPPNAGPNPIYSAVSSDGVNFTVERQVFAYDNIFDPSVIDLGNNQFLMACTQMANMSVNTVLARSTDGGQTFTYEATLQNTGVPELHRFDDGKVRLYYGGPDGIMSKVSQDGGRTWTQEQGSRCKVQGFIGDPGVYQTDPQSWWLFVKGFNGTNNQRPSGHKIQRARSTDRGMSFAITDQLVLDSASVPEGIAFTSRCEISQQAVAQQVCTGERASFALTLDTSVVGATSYRWYRGTTRLSDDARYRGCTTPKLSIDNVSQSDVGEYNCHITMFVATIAVRSIISTPAALTVRSMPRITTDLVDTTMATVGSTVTLRVEGSGAAPRWQWYRNTTALTGATSNTLVLPSVQMSDDGGVYGAVLLDDCDSISSNTTVLRVIDPTSVHESDLDVAMRADPQPARDHVSITFASRGNEVASVDVVDGTGRIVERIEVGSNATDNQFVHQIAHLPNGIYRYIANGRAGVVGATTIVIVR